MYPTSQQSDGQELCRRIVNFLIERGVRRIDRLQLTASGGVLTVGGWLPSDHDRWVCIECCRRTAGVVRIVDHTHVTKARRSRRLRPTHESPSSRPAPVYLNT